LPRFVKDIFAKNP